MTGTSYRLLIFLLIFSPLAFGTVEEWSLAVLEITAVLAFCILLSNQIRNKKALFLMLFLAYIAFQLIPLPPALVKIISPDTYTLYSETIGVTAPLTWLPLTIHKKATLMEFFRFSSYAAVYILTAEKDHYDCYYLCVCCLVLRDSAASSFQ
jgi:hypothetical protein